MKANHRAHAGRCPGAEESLSLDRSREAGRDASAGAHRVDWRISLPGVPAIVATARQLVRAALEGSPRLDDAELVTSELVTNAIRHTPSGDEDSTVRLRILVSAGCARIEVSDLGVGIWVAPSSQGEEDERGRGLVIVHGLADRAGHGPVGGGQLSWAEFSWCVAPAADRDDFTPSDSDGDA